MLRCVQCQPVTKRGCMHTDKNNDEQLDQIKQSVEAESRTTNIGFQNPNSPLDLAGLDPLPESGGIGALDPAAGEDIEGDDQAHDREDQRPEEVTRVAWEQQWERIDNLRAAIHDVRATVDQYAALLAEVAEVPPLTGPPIP